MGTGDNGVEGGDFKFGVHGIDHDDVHADTGQGGDTVFHLHLDVIVGDVQQQGDVYLLRNIEILGQKLFLNTLWLCFVFQSTIFPFSLFNR